MYVCQNGGTVGPWRADEMSVPSIQRIEREGGRAEIIATELDGKRFNGPNDLVFGPDGRLYFTDPGTYRPADPEPSYLFVLDADGSGRLLAELRPADVPQRHRHRGRRQRRVGRVVHGHGPTPATRQRGHRGHRAPARARSPSLTAWPSARTARLYVTTVNGGGIEVLAPDGTYVRHIEAGTIPTNCVFDGRDLIMTDAGVLADTADASYGGQLWRLAVDTEGLPTWYGRHRLREGSTRCSSCCTSRSPGRPTATPRRRTGASPRRRLAPASSRRPARHQAAVAHPGQVGQLGPLGGPRRDGAPRGGDVAADVALPRRRGLPARRPPQRPGRPVMSQPTDDGLAIPSDYVANLFDIAGRVAVITGGGSGLGRAIAIGYAQAGVTSWPPTSTRRAPPRPSGSIAEQGHAAEAAHLDVTQRAEIEALADAVVERHGRVDILVNSAGSAFRSPVEDFPEDKLDFILDLNLKGTYLCCQAFGRKMLAQGKGSIINLASIGSFVAYPWASAYLASKGGVLGITRAMALEWRDRGVRVNGIGPTLMDSPLTRAGGAADVDHRRLHQGPHAAAAARPAARAHRRRDLPCQRRVRARHRPHGHVRRRVPDGMSGPILPFLPR